MPRMKFAHQAISMQSRPGTLSSNRERRCVLPFSRATRARPRPNVFHCHERTPKVRFPLNFQLEDKGSMIKTVEWTSEGVRMLDQRLLPTEEKYLLLRSYEEVADAIKNMFVRGAPAIGVSAAMGLALGANQSVGTSVADLAYDFKFMCKVMEATRPTAVNLFWAVERMRAVLARARTETKDVEEIRNRLTEEALKIFQEDIESNRALGKFGGELIADGSTVLTHCNA